MIELRPAVQWFAEQMERKLREHDDRGGWDNCDEGWLLDRLREETRELAAVIDDSVVVQPDLQAVIDEAADVANFAMMIADKSHGWQQ